MESVLTRSGLWLATLFFAVVFCALAVDRGFAIHMAIVALAALIGLAVSLSQTDYGAIARGIVRMPDQGKYDDDPIRWGVIATVFWGVAGFLAGLYIALELTWPVLNFGLEFINFGRLRPLHTSAVIFAFGGNALIATSFYIEIGRASCRERV